MVYICALPTSSTTVLNVSAPGPLSSTVSCLCFTQCTSCKSLFSFSLLGHYYYCNIRSLTQLFNEIKSSRDYYCTTTTSFKLFSPGLLLPRALLMVYICASPTSSTTVLDVSAPGPLSSTVRCLCFTQCASCKSLFSFSLLGHYYCCKIRSLIFLLDNNSMLLLSCLMMYDNVFVFAVFLVSLHGD